MAGKYGGVAPHVEAAGNEIGSKFSVKDIGGRASSGHISGSDHYTGHALDFMVYADKNKGDQILAYVKANWKRLGVKYAIWYRKYYPSPDKAENYVGTSPHTDHVHVSFTKEAGEGGPAVGSGGTGGSDMKGCLGSIIEAFGWKWW